MSLSCLVPVALCAASWDLQRNDGKKGPCSECCCGSGSFCPNQMPQVAMVHIDRSVVSRRTPHPLLGLLRRASTGQELHPRSRSTDPRWVASKVACLEDLSAIEDRLSADRHQRRDGRGRNREHGQDDGEDNPREKD